jgi:UDP-N-acetylglucosamine 1-carboxyvinyltransferase
MKHYKFYVLFFNSRKVIINNIPDIIDIKLITLLGNLGVKIKNGTWLLYFQDEVNIQYLETEAFKKEGGLRGSIMIVGLFAHGKGYIPKPGGDKLAVED